MHFNHFRDSRSSCIVSAAVSVLNTYNTLNVPKNLNDDLRGHCERSLWTLSGVHLKWFTFDLNSVLRENILHFMMLLLSEGSKSSRSIYSKMAVSLF